MAVERGKRGLWGTPLLSSLYPPPLFSKGSDVARDDGEAKGLPPGGRPLPPLSNGGSWGLPWTSSSITICMNEAPNELGEHA